MTTKEERKIKMEKHLSLVEKELKLQVERAGDLSPYNKKPWNLLNRKERGIRTARKARINKLSLKAKTLKKLLNEN